jgi:hypothetical protein
MIVSVKLPYYFHLIVYFEKLNIVRLFFIRSFLIISNFNLFFVQCLLVIFSKHSLLFLDLIAFSRIILIFEFNNLSIQVFSLTIIDGFFLMSILIIF